MDRVPVSWPEAEPTRFTAEQAAMAAIAPQLTWIGEELAWQGQVPVWPFERPRPPHLDEFLAGRRLAVRVEYSQAFPMVAPRVIPLDPEPKPMVRMQHDWHVNGDGSLCLMQRASDWDGTATAADLVVKASGWFLEYLLMDAGRITQMSTSGVVSDKSYDALFVAETGG